MPELDNTTFKITAVNGSPAYVSKTNALIEEIVNQFSARIKISATTVSVGELLPELATLQPVVGGKLESGLKNIADADFIIAASPIYKGSYSGLFKHIFDLLDPAALAHKPVLLAATGGSQRHTLTLEHQFRPLFTFFQAETLPLAIYGNDTDFTNYKVSSPELLSRISRSVERALPFVSPQLRHDSLLPYL